MHAFQYYVPTEIVFGAGSVSKLPELLKKRKLSRVLVVYGGSSARKSGLLDRVFQLLEKAGVSYQTLGGVQPNPRVALAREGVKLALSSFWPSAAAASSTPARPSRTARPTRRRTCGSSGKSARC